MGARDRNFYFNLACRYGFEDEANRIQELYLDGRKEEAAALVPARLLEHTSLIGPAGYVKERVARLPGGWGEHPQRDPDRPPTRPPTWSSCVAGCSQRRSSTYPASSVPMIAPP